MMMHRARTSFDYYADQMKEDELADFPDMPLQGRETPLGVVRPLSPLGPAPSGRLSRPRSRQTPAMVQRSYTDLPMQTTEPVSYSYDDNPYTSIDPVNKHYYYRLWRKEPPRPQRPIYREGRLGSPWRHIRACINNAGNHLVFIDGTVKSEENYFYPPETTLEPPNFSLYVTPRLAPISPRRQFQSLPRRSGIRDTALNERARQGFRYWPQQPKPIDYSAKYSFGAGSRWLGLQGPALPTFKGRFVA